MMNFGLLILLLIVEVTHNAIGEEAAKNAGTARETCLCAQGNCDYGWVQYKNACYKQVNQHVSWPKAEEICLSFSSHLASIQSSEENDFVFAFMGKPQDPYHGGSYWIGGHDLIKEGLFTWTDGTTMPFKTFGTGQPDNAGGNEQYLGSWVPVRGHITWNDFPLSFTFPFVCKYSLNNRMCNGE